jgi:hypothetical protein
LVKTRNLDELTSQAERIVQASVVSAKVEAHPQYHALHSVLVTVAVRDTLKGPRQKQFTYRQFIWDARDRSDVAGYRKGQELLLFLTKETPEGFTGTVGLNQGRMSIRRGSTGAFVQPGTPPAQLFAGVESTLAAEKKTVGSSIRKAARSESAVIRLDEMKQAVRDLASHPRAQ